MPSAISDDVADASARLIENTTALKAFITGRLGFSCFEACQAAERTAVPMLQRFIYFDVLDDRCTDHGPLIPQDNCVALGDFRVIRDCRVEGVLGRWQVIVAIVTAMLSLIADG
jgi:hypothetical protein